MVRQLSTICRPHSKPPVTVSKGETQAATQQTHPDSSYRIGQICDLTRSHLAGLQLRGGGVAERTDLHLSTTVQESGQDRGGHVALQGVANEAGSKVEEVETKKVVGSEIGGKKLKSRHAGKIICGQTRESKEVNA